MQGAVRFGGSAKDTERVWLPRCSAIPCYLELVEVHRRILSVGNIFVKNFVGIKRSEHVLWRTTERHLERAANESDRYSRGKGMAFRIGDVRSLMDIVHRHHHFHPTTTRT